MIYGFLVWVLFLSLLIYIIDLFFDDYCSRDEQETLVLCSRAGQCQMGRAVEGDLMMIGYPFALFLLKFRVLHFVWNWFAPSEWWYISFHIQVLRRVLTCYDRALVTRRIWLALKIDLVGKASPFGNCCRAVFHIWAGWVHRAAFDPFCSCGASTVLPLVQSAA